MATFLSIGSGPGIGLETARRFAREGYRVVLSARRGDELEKLASELRADGATVEIAVVDAADHAAVSRLVETASSSAGAPLTVVHYNAAILRGATIDEQPFDTFNADLAVNIGGALSAAKAALPGLRSATDASLLLTGGYFGLEPNPGFLSLSIGKAGIRALAHALFEQEREHGVHVATVTVAANVTPDSEEARGIADAFWALHAQPQTDWTAESTYSPNA